MVIQMKEMDRSKVKVSYGIVRCWKYSTIAFNLSHHNIIGVRFRYSAALQPE